MFKFKIRKKKIHCIFEGVVSISLYLQNKRRVGVPLNFLIFLIYNVISHVDGGKSVLMFNDSRGSNQKRKLGSWRSILIKQKVYLSQRQVNFSPITAVITLDLKPICFRSCLVSLNETVIKVDSI